MNLIKQDIVHALKKGIRFDSRGPFDFRDLKVEVGKVKTAEGFAHVKLGKTEVLAGVKLSVDKPFPDTPDEGVLSVNSDLSPMASPDFEAGPPSIKAIELARVVDRGIRESRAVDVKALCIEPKEKVWVVNVDIAPLNDDGNLIDASGIAAILALKNARFPEYDGETVNYKKHTDKKLPVTRVPIPVTVFKFADMLLVDPTSQEESFIDARLTATSMEGGVITALQKGGYSPISVEEAGRMVELSIQKANEIREKIKKFL